MNKKEGCPGIPVSLLIGWALITMFLWFIAFYRSEATPEWLLRVQSVCFGSSQTGLPDTYGWMVLFLSPLSLLTGLLIAMGSDIRAGLAGMARGGAGRTFLVFLLIAVAGESYWVKTRVKHGFAVANASYQFSAPDLLPENYPVLDKPAPDFNLVDQTGQTISLGDLRGKTVIMTYAFAHCTTVCPVIVHNTTKAFNNLPKDDTRLLIVTLDPWRDTPASLPTLAKTWKLQPGSHILSGSVKDVNSVLDLYNVPRKRNLSNGNVTHPALVNIIDQQGHIAYTFNNPTSAWIEQAVANIASKTKSLNR